MMSTAHRADSHRAPHVNVLGTSWHCSRRVEPLCDQYRSAGVIQRVLQPCSVTTMKKNLNENTPAGAMAAVMFEGVLLAAGCQDLQRHDRRLGRGHREARRRHAAGPIVPLQDHRAPSPQPLQVLHMSGTPLFSTHTTYTNRSSRSSRLRRDRQRRATPTRRPRSTSWPRWTTKRQQDALSRVNLR